MDSCKDGSNIEQILETRECTRSVAIIDICTLLLHDIANQLTPMLGPSCALVSPGKTLSGAGSGALASA